MEMEEAATLATNINATTHDEAVSDAINSIAPIPLPTGPSPPFQPVQQREPPTIVPVTSPEATRANVNVPSLMPHRENTGEAQPAATTTPLPVSTPTKVWTIATEGVATMEGAIATPDIMLLLQLAPRSTIDYTIMLHSDPPTSQSPWIWWNTRPWLCCCNVQPSKHLSLWASLELAWYLHTICIQSCPVWPRHTVLW